MMLGKLQRSHPTFRGHFAPAYLGGSNKLEVSLWSKPNAPDLGNDVNDNLCGHELAHLHELEDLQAALRPGHHLMAQQIT